MRYRAYFATLAAIFLIGCGEKPAPVRQSAPKDPRVASAEEKINKTTAEGKAMIEKVQGMKPEVNDQVSTKTLKEIVDDYAQNKGAYNISVIGWEASPKKLQPGQKEARWKIVFHYQDYQKQLLAAEWEFNPDSNKLYPFEVVNAPGFWTSEGAQPSSAKKGK
jgi:hypothetical protein